MDQLSIFSSSDLPAKDSVSPESVSDWMIRVLIWPSTPLELCAILPRAGSSLRTSLASFPVGPVLRAVQIEWTLDSETGEPSIRHLSKAPTSPSGFDGFRTSGILAPGACWMLNSSEWPSAASVCSLSDILETGAVPQRYYLSPKACAGILRRAEKRGKELPPQLHQALLAVTGQVPDKTLDRGGNGD